MSRCVEKPIVAEAWSFRAGTDTLSPRSGFYPRAGARACVRLTTSPVNRSPRPSARRGMPVPAGTVPAAAGHRLAMLPVSVPRLLGIPNRLVEPAALGAGRRQGVQAERLLPAGQLTRPCRILHCLRAVPQFGHRTRAWMQVLVPQSDRCSNHARSPVRHCLGGQECPSRPDQDRYSRFSWM
jgi:hypothetical protein